MHDDLEPAAGSDGDLARRVASGERGATEAEAELCRRLGPRVRLYGLRHRAFVRLRDCVTGGQA